MSDAEEELEEGLSFAMQQPEEEDQVGGETDDEEGEVHDGPTVVPEPSYENANNLHFYRVCERLDKLFEWRKATSKKKQRSEQDKLMMLLPPKLMASLEKPRAPGAPPESIFPLYRLLMPDKDGSRHFNIKEATVAKMYAQALALPKESDDYRKLHNYTNPSIVPPDMIGDLGQVVRHVVSRRVASNAQVDKPYTVGEINALLDELANFRVTNVTTSHDWNRDGQESAKKKAKRPKLQDLRADWVRALIPGQSGNQRGLSPMEHMWLVKIIHGGINIGIGYATILRWRHPMAQAFYSAHNSLRAVCTKIAYFSGDQALDKNENKTLSMGYLPRSKVQVEFGKPFEPMRSERTGFDRALSEISARHRDAAKDRALELVPLSMVHPVFTVETKLDGERMLFHINENGTVKVHSRSAKWYSDLYSPVLGPAIRRAVSKYKLNLILDGEVLAWDSLRQETVPFGNNRTIAKLRQKYMEARGMCDSRDVAQHDDDKDIKSMNVNNSYNEVSDQPYELVGDECWLVFVAFDVVYVSGHDAHMILDDTVSKYITPRPKPGSLLDLDLCERKKLLYRIVDPQEHEVEIVETRVVRPNGRTELGADYFSFSNPIMEKGIPAHMEKGIPAHTVDSIACCLGNAVPNLTKIDLERRQGKSDEEVSLARARAIDSIYKSIVEDQRMEGLLFKDLSTPYLLGSISKTLRYWRKFKPDYFNGSTASDIDLVIVGAYFATGLRSAGQPSSFLCACVDQKDDRFLMPVCKVNGRSLEGKLYSKLLHDTGYQFRDGVYELGRWFRYGDGDRSLPDFISRRSNQRGAEGNGWRVTKGDYPDLWIRPDDSYVVTLNAGEIVFSDAFSPGVTLRFPRIHRLRSDDDAKSPHEAETDQALLKIYQDVMEARSSSINDGTNTSLPVESQTPIVNQSACRFLTETQFKQQKSTRKGRKRAGTTLQVPTVAVKAEEIVSDRLKGLRFVVLDGKYLLHLDPIDVAVAKQGGWFEEAQAVNSSDCVRSFILKHGGMLDMTPQESTTYVVGGRKDDQRVQGHVDGIESALHSALTTTSTKSQTARRNLFVSQQPGVLRWIFVYDLVSTTGEGVTSRKPTVLDYLLRPKGATSQRLASVEAISNLELSSTSELWRALELVGGNQSNDENYPKPWLSLAMDMDPTDRWVLNSGRQALWPYKVSDDISPTGQHVVIYPDLCKENAVAGESLDRAAIFLGGVESCLPLARVLGATISEQLDGSVTYILCDLAEDVESLPLSNFVTPDRFTDARHGESFLQRLRRVQELSQDDWKPTLISPQWIRQLWASTESAENDHD